ncbi:hypothetical protein EBU94_05940 [bacterium]|nr:hypothetical protein [bacterium]
MYQQFNQKTEEERPYKKFVETFTFGDESEEFEVLTDSGWVDIKAVGKTVEYEVWEIVTENYNLKGADTHIVYKCSTGLNNFTETFINELNVGDYILTETGLEEIKAINQTGSFENMYDLQLADENRRFFTNGILSHNSIWLANLAANSVRMGYNTAVISLEMRDRKVIKYPLRDEEYLGINLPSIDELPYCDQSFFEMMLENLNSDQIIEIFTHMLFE